MKEIQRALEGLCELCGCKDPDGHYDTCTKAQENLLLHSRLQIINTKYGYLMGVCSHGKVYVNVDSRNSIYS